MRFIKRSEISTLEKGEAAICIDDLSIIMNTQYEGYREIPMAAWKQLSSEIRQSIIQAIATTKPETNIYKAKGSLAANQIKPALLIEDNVGNVYNISGAFTTTNDFIEGKNKTYPAGTNIVIIEVAEEEYKFDVLGGFIDTSIFLTSLPDYTTDIETDAEDTTKLVTPKAVYDFVTSVIGDIESALDTLLGV